MNNFLYKMERKFGKYAIRNLSLVLILCYGAGYLISILNPTFLYYLTLNPYQILHGQVWRLVTWIMVPPSSLDFFTLIMLYFYYSVGTNLERTWGVFRYNLYLLSGMIFTIIGSFVLYAILNVQNEVLIQAVGAGTFFSNNTLGGGYFMLFSTYYINMSIFLGFAATFPNLEVMLMFLIPIKVKYLGLIYAVLLIYNFLMSPLTVKVVILASLLNFLVFFLTTRNYKQISPKEIKRKQNFRRAVKMGEQGRNSTFSGGKTVVTRHRCAVCGRTELDDETLEFRFCSKCEGNYEYCMDHLYTHEHVHRG